jgi:hypothetical protein
MKCLLATAAVLALTSAATAADLLVISFDEDPNQYHLQLESQSRCQGLLDLIQMDKQSGQRTRWTLPRENRSPFMGTIEWAICVHQDGSVSR